MQPLGFLCFTGNWMGGSGRLTKARGLRPWPASLGHVGALDGGSSFYMSILRKPNGALSN